MNVLRIGETSHGADFCVLREKGYPHYLLLLVETPALFEADGEWISTPAHTAFLFRPGQRHSYRAAGEAYTDCWMHLANESPLLFEAFPFGRPIPLLSTERFYGLFRILTDEFFSARRTRESVVSSLCSALIEMIASEVEVRSPLFYSFLALREEVFRSPARAFRRRRSFCSPRRTASSALPSAAAISMWSTLSASSGGRRGRRPCASASDTAEKNDQTVKK